MLPGILLVPSLTLYFPLVGNYSTKGLYIFSLAEPDHFMSLLNGERWYIAISRLIPTLFAGKLWPAKLSDEARGHSGRSNLSGPRFGLLLSALYIPRWSALRTSTSWSLEELYVCFCEQHDNEDLDSDSAQFCQTQFLIHICCLQLLTNHNETLLWFHMLVKTFATIIHPLREWSLLLVVLVMLFYWT